MTDPARPRRSRLARLVRSPQLWVAVVVLAVAAPQGYAWHHLRAAREAVAADDSATTIRHLDRCRAVWPWTNRVEVRRLAARVAWRSGDTPGAMDDLRAARRREGETTPELALEWALVQAADGNVAEVSEFLQRQGTTDPAVQRLTWEALGTGYLAVYRTGDAYTVAQLWLERRPDDLLALELRGRAAIQGRGLGLRLGIDDLRKVLEQRPDKSALRATLAAALLDVGAFQEAIPELERLTREEPNRADHKVRLARCLKMADRPAEAAALLDAVLAADPDDAVALRTRGQFALSGGKSADAERDLARAAHRLPGDYQTQYLYYQALAQAGRPTAAEQLKVAEAAKQTALRLSEIQARRLSERPFDPALYVELGTLLLKAGRAAEGLRWLDDALSLDPAYPPAHAALAAHFRAAGDPARAAFHESRAAGRR